MVYRKWLLKKRWSGEENKKRERPAGSPSVTGFASFRNTITRLNIAKLARKVNPANPQAVLDAPELGHPDKSTFKDKPGKYNTNLAVSIPLYFDKFYSLIQTLICPGSRLPQI